MSSTNISVILRSFTINAFKTALEKRNGDEIIGIFKADGVILDKPSMAAVLDSAFMKGVILTAANMYGVNASSAQLYGGAKLNNAIIENINLYSSSWVGSRSIRSVILLTTSMYLRK